MSNRLVVNGTTYEYPAPGEDPNWGGEASDWAQAVTDVLSTLQGPGDILETTFTIGNNISVATNINGLLFDSGTVRGGDINYTVYRTSTANPAGHAEIGVISLVFDDSAASGFKWSLIQDANGAAGIVFTVTDGGQIQYRSTDIGTTGYSGVIHFRAKALLK